jgi:hypothetical protein
VTEPIVVNFSDADRKRDFMFRLAALRDRWKITLEKCGPRRSIKSNQRYWAAVIPTFQRFMQQHGQYFTKEEIHEFALQKFASRAVVNPLTGDVLSVIGQRSSKMNQERFIKFVEDFEGWMVDVFGLVVPEVEMLRVADAAKGAAA